MPTKDNNFKLTVYSRNIRKLSYRNIRKLSYLKNYWFLLVGLGPEFRWCQKGLLELECFQLALLSFMDRMLKNTETIRWCQKGLLELECFQLALLSFMDRMLKNTGPSP